MIWGSTKRGSPKTRSGNTIGAGEAVASSSDQLVHGDFSDLAEDYSRFRPQYAARVLEALLALAPPKTEDLHVVDVGAGTGIWSRMVAQHGCSVTAVEPNDAMREQGERHPLQETVTWCRGAAESTGLPAQCCDILTMASAFHWADFEQAIIEFIRILRSGGLFCALWNPRLIEVNPLLVKIEERLHELVPDLKRVSSGRSEFCAGLTERLISCKEFENDVLYLEARHTERMSPDRYVGAWRSVNDVRVQAGPKRFSKFLSYVEQQTCDLTHIDACYLTRAWVARRK